MITVPVSVAVILGSKADEKMEKEGNKEIQQVAGTQLRRDLAHSWFCWSKALASFQAAEGSTVPTTRPYMCSRPLCWTRDPGQRCSPCRVPSPLWQKAAGGLGHFLPISIRHHPTPV